MPIYRTEHASVVWALESNFGERAASGYRTFGLHDTVTAPDPAQEWEPFFGVGGGRNRSQMLRGRWAMRGTIPDIRLINGVHREILALALGRIEGSSIVEGRSDTDERINSMTMQVALRDTDGNYSFVREWYGGKINRATLSANEGADLRLGLDEILFKDVGHNRPGVKKYSAAVQPVFADTPPGGRWVFAGGTMVFFGTVIARVRRVSLAIDNKLDTRYYIARSMGDGLISQVPSDLVEGRREYKLTVDIDVADPATDLTFWNFLMNEAANSPTGPTIGGQCNLLFTQMTGEGTNNMFVACGLSPSTAHPGAVVTGGTIDIPAPPAGLLASTWTIDVDSVSIAA